MLLLRARSFAKISIYYRLSTVLIKTSFNQECSLFPWLKSTLSSFLCSCRLVCCFFFLILFIISLFSGFSLGLFCFTMQTCLNLLRRSFFIHGLYENLWSSAGTGNFKRPTIFTDIYFICCLVCGSVLDNQQDWKARQDLCNHILHERGPLLGRSQRLLFTVQCRTYFFGLIFLVSFLHAQT